MVIIARSRKDNRCWTSCGRGGLSLLLGESFGLLWLWACSDPAQVNLKTGMENGRRQPTEE